MQWSYIDIVISIAPGYVQINKKPVSIVKTGFKQYM
jgi:hypothetical protein